MRRFLRLRVHTLVGLITLLVGTLLTSRLAGSEWVRSASPPAQAQTIKYAYDGAGRLVRVDYANGARITYTYDNAGNLLRRDVVAGR